MIRPFHDLGPKLHASAWLAPGAAVVDMPARRVRPVSDAERE